MLGYKRITGQSRLIQENKYPCSHVIYDHSKGLSSVCVVPTVPNANIISLPQSLAYPISRRK